MFTPELKLIPEGRGRFTLAASIPVPNPGYTPGKTAMGAPKSHPVAAGVIACRLFVSFKPAKAPGQSLAIQHQVAGLRVPEGATVTAFVMRGATVLGQNSIVHAAGEAPEPGNAAVFRTTVFASLTTSVAHPPMTPELAQPIVVNATPHPENFSDPDQLLVKLGVTDATQTSLHKTKIQNALRDQGFSIKTADIKSGPGVSVADCRDSVVQNAS